MRSATHSHKQQLPIRGHGQRAAYFLRLGFVGRKFRSVVSAVCGSSAMTSRSSFGPRFRGFFVVLRAGVFAIVLLH